MSRQGQVNEDDDLVIDLSSDAPCSPASSDQDSCTDPPIDIISNSTAGEIIACERFALSDNPFAAFGFGQPDSKPSRVPIPPKDTHGLSGTHPKQSDVLTGHEEQSTLWPALSGRKRPLDLGKSITSQANKKKGTPKEDRGCLSVDELERLSPSARQVIRCKWQALADPGAGPDVQRFQILVAVILSSRAQSSVVEEALRRLQARDGGLTCDALADMDLAELSHLLRSVHYNQAKSKHVKETARLVRDRFRGKVPTKEKELLGLAGVGPALAKLLTVVNMDTCRA